MLSTTISRRAVLCGALGALAISALPAAALRAAPAIHVLKDPDCGCCGAWIEILEAEGFAVTTELVPAEALARFKLRSGVPEQMASCHTARIGSYLVEGHVPPADIRRLLSERPDALGLAVPGMPWGAPGMGPETERDAYDVFLIRHDGSTELFTRYDAA